MKLKELKEPDLSNPEEFMNNVHQVAKTLYGNYSKKKLEFKGFLYSNPQTEFNLFKSSLEIKISIASQTNKISMALEISHEVFHALMPATPQKWITVLEEGMATDFSLIVLEHLGYKYFGENNDQLAGNYGYAANLVRTTKINNPETIKRIRKLAPCLSDVKKETILSQVKISEVDVNKLLADFYKLDVVS